MRCHPRPRIRDRLAEVAPRAPAEARRRPPVARDQHRRVPGATPALFEFAGQGGASLLATQAFPMHDGDVVYVAEAPIVPVARLLNTVFQLALPASLAR